MDLNEYRKTLALSVDKEVEAYEFYKQASEKANDPMLKKLFKEFSEEERKHMQMIQSFLADESLPFSIDATADFKISETVERPKMSVEMKFVDAIALAMKNEEDAMNTYKSFAASASDPDQKKMFENLANMETGHKTRLEEIFSNAAYAEAWD
jgi:rubrerythrin